MGFVLTNGNNNGGSPTFFGTGLGKEDIMFSRHRSMRWSVNSSSLFALAIAGMVSAIPGSVLAAGSCMDGKLSCSINYIYNDTQIKIIKSVKIDYSATISPSVKTRVECSQVADGTTDLDCRSWTTYAYIYQIKAAYPGRIKNPGYSAIIGDTCEKVCNALGIGVYYMNGRPL